MAVIIKSVRNEYGLLVLQIERVDFKADIQFFGITSIFSHADALEVDIRGFLTE